MATSTNAKAISTHMATYTYMPSNILYIIINYSFVQDPWSEPDPQVNSFCFSYNVSVNYNDDNLMPPLFYLMTFLMRI